jgi:hypothetical protein
MGQKINKTNLMTKLFTLLLFIGIYQSSLAQCQTMNERDFQMAKQRMSMNSRNINTYQAAMDLGRMYCLSSAQARDIANFLANDRDKLDFLKSSFPTIADKENFTDVMDVFRLMSMAFKLYHTTLGSINSGSPIPAGSQNPNCQRPLDMTSFQALLRKLTTAPDDRSRASQLLNTTQCMMTAQIIQLTSSIQDENIKVDVLKRLMPLVYDIENYNQAANSLSSNNRNLFLAFLQNPNQSPTNAVSEVDYNNFLTAIKNQSFEKDKESYIKTYMKNAYLTTAQIKTIVALLTYDSSKLDIAKFFFTNCVDKQNYFNVAEIMQFSSSKNDLKDYVKGKM